VIAKVSSGQKLRIPAEAYNAFVDAAEAYQAQLHQQGVDRRGVPLSPGEALVRNDSGADLERFAVIGLDAPLISPDDNLLSFQEHRTFSGVSPEEHLHANRFGVLQEPIPAGAIGRVLLIGVTPVQLAVQAMKDDLAAVVTGETASLKSGTSGGARILWKPDQTGLGWGLIAFPAGGTEGSAPNLVLTVTVPNHPWMPGDVLRWSGTAWVDADAAVVGATDTLAVVGRIPDPDTALLVLWGLCCLDDLTDHTDYWLDPAIPGTLTAVKPASNPHLVLHHAANRLCVVRAGAGGGSGDGSGGGATRFADLTDVDVSVAATNHQAALWDAAAQRWKPHDIVVGDPVPAHQVLAGPTAGANAKPAFREFMVGDLAEVAGTSVVANATGGSARPTALAATQDDRVLMRVGGTLQWLQLTTGALADGIVTTDKLAAGAVTDPKIVSLAWAKLTGVPLAFPPTAHVHALTGDVGGWSNNTVIAPAAVTTDKLADSAVTDPKIASVAWGKLTGVPATFPAANHTHPLGGDLSGTTANAQIVAGAVGTTKIADAAVTNAKLAKDFLHIGTTDWHLGDTVTGLMVNPMTAAGDLIIGGPAGTPLRLQMNAGGTLQVVTSKSGITSLQPLILDLLEDVVVTTPQDQQVLTYDAASSSWRNAVATATSTGHGPHPAFVAKIVAKVSGNSYTVTLYPEYPSLAVAWVTTATQLQADPTKIIPANTWTIACGILKAGQPGTAVAQYDLFLQVPVWM